MIENSVLTSKRYYFSSRYYLLPKVFLYAVSDTWPSVYHRCADISRATHTQYHNRVVSLRVVAFRWVVLHCLLVFVWQYLEAWRFCNTTRDWLSIWNMFFSQDPFDNLPDVFKENMPHKQVLAFNKFWNETGRREVTTDSFISEVLQLIVLNLKQEAAGTEKMR